jgi:hypothetical protein
MVLNDAQLAQLASSPAIRSQLRTPELQRLLLTVDGSRSRLDALAAAQHNVPEFQAFCNLVLSSIKPVYPFSTQVM